LPKSPHCVAKRPEQDKTEKRPDKNVWQPSQQGPRKTIRYRLNDSKILRQCIPGCETIKAPESCRISGKGQDGLAGFATGGATVKFTENSFIETLMDYDVDAQVGGKPAMLDSRLMDSAAKSLAGPFFTKFSGRLENINICRTGSYFQFDLANKKDGRRTYVLNSSNPTDSVVMAPFISSTCALGKTVTECSVQNCSGLPYANEIQMGKKIKAVAQSRKAVQLR
jgi:carbon monoxide dehydrogenase subunit G